MPENPQELFAQVESPAVIADWTVTLTQGDRIWSIHSTDPSPNLKTLGGCGVFEVRVEWRNSETKVVKLLERCRKPSRKSAATKTVRA